jgi:hypothetical protein
MGHQIAVAQLDAVASEVWGDESAMFDDAIGSVFDAFYELMRQSLDEQTAPAAIEF